MRLSFDYARIRAGYLKKEITKLPKGRICKRMCRGRAMDCVYISNAEDKYLEKHYYALGKEPGKTLGKLVSRRNIMEKELLELETMIETMTGEDLKIPEALKNNWEAVKNSPEASYSLPLNGPVFNGNKFRSKSEAMIAMILDEMGLEYVYEPVLILGGRKIRPDFAFWVKESGRIIYIEHFGMTDISTYRDGMIKKVALYMSEGFVEGRDIIFIFENQSSGVDLKVMRQKINAAVMSGF
ncbi:MAG: hypothetical protein J5883_02985 [Clostridiales bacterium]|nr:hypothetical protein [Clostridiales bacterium]